MDRRRAIALARDALTGLNAVGGGANVSAHRDEIVDWLRTHK